MSKKIGDYLNRVFFIFGIIVFFLAVESFVVGEGAKAVTIIFTQEGLGLPSLILLQFLGLACVITALTQFTMSDNYFKNDSSTKRFAILVVLCFVATLIFIVSFNWFKMNSVISWLYFLLCFVLSFGFSVLLTAMKEKQENKKLEDALVSYKSKLMDESED